jgi:chaperonin cofactor prefoldin
MAKNAWENSLSEQELAAMGAGRAGRGSSVGRWILWLFVIGALTLAGAYYLPLYRAHKELTQSYASLSSNTKVLETSVQSLQTELSTTKARKDELEARVATTSSKEKAAQDRLKQLETRLQAKLAKYAKHGALTLTGRGDRVVVALEPAEGRLATTPEPTPAERAVLCDVAGATHSNGSFNVEVLVYAEAGANATTWAQAADRATLAAQALHEKCSYPIERVAAVTRQRAANAPTPTPWFEIHFLPAEPKNPKR